MMKKIIVGWRWSRMALDILTFSRTKRLVNRKIQEAGGMTNEGIAALVKENVGPEVNAYLGENEIQGMSDAKNVKLLGADNTGETDSSTIINPIANESLFFPEGTYTVDYETLKVLKNNASKLSGTGNLKATVYKGADNYGGTIKDYVEEINTGLIPLDLLNDEIYMSMKTPSDCAGPLKRPYPRHIYSLSRLINEGKTPTKAHVIFAIYPVPGVDLPDTMTFKIGALKLYGYSKKCKKWVILAENVPCQWNTNVHYVENGQWTGEKEAIADCISRTEEDYITVTIDKERLLKGVVHCGSTDVIFGTPNEFPGDIADYEYIVSSASASCDTEDCTYMTCAVDYVYNSTYYQAYYGRNIYLKNEIQTMWSHNIPDYVYRDVVDTERLMQFFKKEIALTENKKYRLLIPPLNTNENNTSLDYVPIMRIYNGCSRLNAIMRVNSMQTAHYKEIFAMFSCPSSVGVFSKTLNEGYIWDNSNTSFDSLFTMVQDDEDKTSYTLYANRKSTAITLELEIFYGSDYVNYFEFLGKQTQNIPVSSDVYGYSFVNALETYDLADATVLKTF